MRMFACLNRCAVVCLAASLWNPAQAQAAASGATHTAANDDDPKVILELGTSASWNTSGGAVSYAPNVAAEVTPIENWLEIEAGISPFFSHGSSEWDTDLLFKKPWTLSPTAEFMAGLGPEWVHTSSNGRSTNSLAGEVAGDFMFWPTGRHRFGWYLEPAYDYSFSGTHEQSLGISAGLLIGFGRGYRDGEGKACRR